jgi:signal transduction histidine kinase
MDFLMAHLPRIALALTLAAASTSLANAAEIKALRVWAGPEYTRAVFDVSGPLDYRIFDLSDPRENNWLYRLANKLHINTRPDVIRQLLLFNTGEPVSVQRIEETERLLRERQYLYEARIELEEDLRKQAEAERQKVEYLLRTAKEANLLKDEFLASVSHELNTPLNAILGSSTLLLEEFLTEARRRT